MILGFKQFLWSSTHDARFWKLCSSWCLQNNLTESKAHLHPRKHFKQDFQTLNVKSPWHAPLWFLDKQLSQFHEAASGHQKCPLQDRNCKIKTASSLFKLGGIKTPLSSSFCFKTACATSFMFITFLYLILILRSDKKLRSFLLRVAWYIYTILTQHSKMFPVLLSLVELFTSDSLLIALIFCETNCEVAFMMLLTWYVTVFWIHYIGLKDFPWNSLFCPKTSRRIFFASFHKELISLSSIIEALAWVEGEINCSNLFFWDLLTNRRSGMVTEIDSLSCFL